MKVFRAANAALGLGAVPPGPAGGGPQETPIKAAQVVGVVARLLAPWWLNACRIVYVVDENGPVEQLSPALTTFPLAYA